MTTAVAEKISTRHWTMFLFCFLGTAFGGMISTLMSVYLPVAVQDLLGSKNESELSTISAYINSIFIVGAAAGGFLCGVISDKWGRRPAIILAIAGFSSFAILTGFMSDWWQVVICRFFSGFGVGGMIVTGTTLIAEEWPASTKAILVGILSISFPVGIFSAGAIDYFVSSWRQAFLVGIIPLFLSVLAIWLLGESNSWKQDKETGNKQAKEQDSIFAASHRKDLLIGAVTFGTMLIGLWAIFLWIPTWIHDLINEGDGQEQRGMSMMILGIGGLTGGFFSGWVINAIGTRRSMLLCFGLCAICSFLLFKTNSSFSPVIYAEIAVLALSFGVSQGVLSVYIPGMFPVSIRGTATGFCFNSGRLLTAVAVLFVGVLVTALGGYSNSLFIFSLVFVIGFITTYLTKEKK